MTPVLTAQKLRVAFAGVIAVDDVSFTIEEGTTTALIGPNGAGKTTLLNLVCGLENGAGKLALKGTDITSWGPARRAAAGIARSFQTPILCEELSILDNIRVGRSNRAAPRSVVSDLCQSLQMDLDLDESVDRLTHRDRRMVEIARTLISKPTLVLLDEPAAGLSQEESDDLMAAVLSVAHRTGAAVAIIEHNMTLVMRWAERVIVLDRGALLAHGTPYEIQRNTSVIATYLGEQVPQ
ncbi:ABC transporter ATP-binding protein [Nocardia sp. NPDC052278]|uniref:ABC transporter ATP-binding protein n=1 Tax=unclassified Nocardia TaxID=2637762 RepID=UPI00368F7602